MNHEETMNQNVTQHKGISTLGPEFDSRERIPVVEHPSWTPGVDPVIEAARNDVLDVVARLAQAMRDESEIFGMLHDGELSEPGRIRRCNRRASRLIERGVRTEGRRLLREIYIAHWALEQAEATWSPKCEQEKNA